MSAVWRQGPQAVPELPADALSAGIVLAAAAMPLPAEELVCALARLGAPGFQPVRDAVLAAIERLIDRGWLIQRAAAPGENPVLEPSAAAIDRLAEMIDRLPLSAGDGDLACRLKVMSLDLLTPETARRQLVQLLDHWQGVEAFWQRAISLCPCRQSAVRGLMRHKRDLARFEIDWLTAVRRAHERQTTQEAS